MAKRFVTAEERVHGFRLAVSGCIRDHVIGNPGLAAFLLLHLRLKERKTDGDSKFLESLGISEYPEDIEDLLALMARRESNAQTTADSIDENQREKYALQLLSMFRKGSLGPMLLDDLQESSAATRAYVREAVPARSTSSRSSMRAYVAPCYPLQMQRHSPCGAARLARACGARTCRREAAGGPAREA
eukprot:CAMPEP_0170199250 /NCGR_PEP_ID=MMETSP0040_2-20121228/69234_1 /TAXON_ID=641309 /ORGANISM="Lotharella oceanica, Strain CCMP622" /LENGTH=187 /DNA_ID=CAMNT_0010449349 /DNA_START=629 /DNA_END=1189 /DNA_ORIENTATION=-